MNKKIIITGASSFLGKCLYSNIKSLSFDTLATSNHEDKENEIILVDLTNKDQVFSIIQEYVPDIVIHAGAFVDLSRDYETGRKCLEVNTLGTMNLLESVKGKQSLFVYISSEEVYGNGPIPFREDQSVDPPSPYAISKVAGEHLCRWYGKEYNFPIVIVRFGTFYGPEQPPNKYFAQVIANALNNEPILCNSGKKKRDYIYIDDAVNLIIKIVQKDRQHLIEQSVINATGGKSYQLLDVIDMVKRLTHSTSLVKIGAIQDRITERDEWIADISNAKVLFEWEPQTTLEEGMSLMVEYFKKIV